MPFPPRGTAVSTGAAALCPCYDFLSPPVPCVRGLRQMESKGGALLHSDSRFPSSAPHTGQARFRASGVLTNRVCLTRQNSHDVSQDDTLCRVPMLVLV